MRLSILSLNPNPSINTNMIYMKNISQLLMFMSSHSPAAWRAFCSLFIDKPPVFVSSIALKMSWEHTEVMTAVFTFSQEKKVYEKHLYLQHDNPFPKSKEFRFIESSSNRELNCCVKVYHKLLKKQCFYSTFMIKDTSIRATRLLHKSTPNPFNEWITEL